MGKTFASQFISNNSNINNNKSESLDIFDRLILAVKNSKTFKIIL